jgi:hypothetical protein
MEELKKFKIIFEIIILRIGKEIYCQTLQPIILFNELPQSCLSFYI